MGKNLLVSCCCSPKQFCPLSQEVEQILGVLLKKNKYIL